jgi:hypothetical protein
MAQDHLEVHVDASSIFVTDPYTNSLVIYQKQLANPQLVLTYSWLSVEHGPSVVSEFPARAFQAAVTKARQLGWSIS